MMLKVLRDVRALIRQSEASEIEVNVHHDVAFALLNRKRDALVELERHFDRRITVRGDPGLLLEQLSIQTRSGS